MGYIDEVLAKYRRHGNNATLDWNRKINDQLLSLSLMVTEAPELISHIRQRRAEIYLMFGIRLALEKKYLSALKFLSLVNTMTFPKISPWIRIVIREIRFLIKTGDLKDDLVWSLISKNSIQKKN